MESCNPVRYVLEIRSYSQLLKERKYESEPFKAGGYNWKLVADGANDDHIILKLRICDTERLNDGRQVLAKFKFSVFVQAKSQYEAISDSNADGFKAFHKTKNSHVAKKFTHKCFEEKYVANNSCGFLAEVFVTNPAFIETVFVPAKNNSTKTLNVPISHLISSTNSDKDCNSDKFQLGGVPWKWRITVRKDPEEKKKEVLFIFLKPCVPNNDGYEDIKASFELRVKGRGKSVKQKHEYDSWTLEKRFSIHNFMPIRDLCESDNGYIKNQSINVEVEILKVLAVKKG